MRDVENSRMFCDIMTEKLARKEKVLQAMGDNKKFVNKINTVSDEIGVGLMNTIKARMVLLESMG